jgi:serine/threonine-protein kinase
MKFFPPIASSAEEFRKEASAMRQRHPHIVGLLDAGVAEDGSPYLVIEYVPGRDARTLLEEEAPETTRALEIGAQVFAGLDALHRAGLVHGDIKPENIRLSQKEKEARLVDFGRARLRHIFGTTQIFPGTPPYMLPSLFRVENALIPKACSGPPRIWPSHVVSTCPIPTWIFWWKRA